MQQAIEELRAADVGAVLASEPLANYTTWAIGGPADLLVSPKGKQELADAVRILGAYGIPWITLGRGSNMLVSDKGYRGAVIHLGKGLDDLRFEDTKVIAGASLSLIVLCNLVGKRGLSGLEFAGGIPGTVGGAVYMNAGAHGSDVSRILLTAEILTENGELVRYSNEDMEFGYRHSVLQRTHGIVTEAEFQLSYGDRKEIAAAMAAYKERRIKTQPLHMPCAGSVFRNPEGHHAARLIEEAGLKGKRVGGAEVSTMHANFIVNTGNASAEDVLALIEQVKEEIHRKFGVSLVPEVLMVGER